MDREDVERSVLDVLRNATATLAIHGIPSAQLDAEVLLAHCLKITREVMLFEKESRAGVSVPDQARRQFSDLIERRIKCEPVAYLVGHKEFWSLDLQVTPAVLIPRPETEHLVERVLKILPPAGSSSVRVIDVGTGSGAIAIALAHERDDLIVAGVDRSVAALRVARANAQRHHVAARCLFVQGDLLEAFDAGHGYGAVVSNPPYLRRAERSDLMPDVRDYEPQEALFDDDEGGLVHRLVVQASRVLCEGGWFVMEMADQRASQTLAILEGMPVWSDVGMDRDLAGLPRVARARRRAHL